MKPQLPLAARHVVLTREATRNASLAEAIRQAGGVPVSFPLLQVQALPDVSPPENLAAVALAIFISPAAVRFGVPLLGLRLADLSVAAVGEGTAAALRRHGVARVMTPTCGSGADALLATLDIDALRGRQVLIVRGDAGRSVLREALARQGVQVSELSCYRRSCPQTSLQPVWAQGCDAIIISSSEALRHLVGLADADAPNMAKLIQTPLFVIHPRIAKAATDLGWRDVYIAGASDDEMLAALTDRFTALHIR